ncbi:hypothetical protein KY290_033937 [Solanum tuberosum]|uniref:Uncharacterized protein n=1 Tax=Solanum tuberosum TaxID=4113 RepID=A0ABQ7U2U3_SOLTU|nr:hypothetical protein KY289_033321 [Solanum tuberosum]KAH0647963.1 hypothetical protein KY285_033211 [Solanum tuberosum]KAH0740894.1 hypothetical protein KY290_033937 [Solanum tuberosum]
MLVSGVVVQLNIFVQGVEGKGIGVAANVSGANGRGRGTGLAATTIIGAIGWGRGTGVVATATNVLGATGRGKRPRMIGMGILHTQSGFTIHNPGMHTNSSVVTGNLGPHKPRLSLKCKGNVVVTKAGNLDMIMPGLIRFRSASLYR